MSGIVTQSALTRNPEKWECSPVENPPPSIWDSVIQLTQTSSPTLRCENTVVLLSAQLVPVCAWIYPIALDVLF